MANSSPHPSTLSALCTCGHDAEYHTSQFGCNAATPDGEWCLCRKTRIEVEHVQLAARVRELEAALECAEQTIRNLGNGWLTGDGQTIALNEAANIREALEGGAS